MTRRIDQKRWRDKLDRAEKDYGFTDGYHLLFCPWSTLKDSDFAFISANPGRTEHAENRHRLSDERRNSYEVERHTTASPITQQFLLLMEMLSVAPSDVLTGVAAPFRSNRWEHLSPVQKEVAIEHGVAFWREVIDAKPLKFAVIVGDLPMRVMERLDRWSLEADVASGWGSTRLKRFSNGRGASLFKLPHLSQFRLLSRSECRGPLQEIFSEIQ